MGGEPLSGQSCLLVGRELIPIQMSAESFRDDGGEPPSGRSCIGVMLVGRELLWRRRGACRSQGIPLRRLRCEGPTGRGRTLRRTFPASLSGLLIIFNLFFWSAMCTSSRFESFKTPSKRK